MTIKDKSFTLIELLIVLVILGILVSLTIPLCQSFIQKAKAEEGKRVVRAMANNIMYYYEESSSFPVDPQELMRTCNTPPLSKYFTYGGGVEMLGDPIGVLYHVNGYYKILPTKNGQTTEYFINMVGKSGGPAYISLIQSSVSGQEIQYQYVGNCMYVFCRHIKGTADVQYNWD